MEKGEISARYKENSLAHVKSQFTLGNSQRAGLRKQVGPRAVLGAQAQPHHEHAKVG